MATEYFDQRREKIREIWTLVKGQKTLQEETLFSILVTLENLPARKMFEDRCFEYIYTDLAGDKSRNFMIHGQLYYHWMSGYSLVLRFHENINASWKIKEVELDDIQADYVFDFLQYKFLTDAMYQWGWNPNEEETE